MGSTKQTIVFLVSNDHYSDQRMQRICGTLHNNGFEVVLVGRQLDNPIANYKYNVVLLPLKYKSGPKFYWELMNAQIKHVTQSIKHVDIISTVDADTLLAGRKIAKHHQAKHIHDAHEWFTEVPELQGKWIKQKIWNWVERKCLTNIIVGYTVSERISKYYSKLAGINFSLIHNYPIKKENINSTKEFDIIYQGAINKGRCVQELVLLAIKNNYNVCICGDGDEFEEVTKLAKGHANIHLKGLVKPEELQAFTCKAKIGYNYFEVISKSYDESMSNKVFDYIQAGIPQVISYSKAIYSLNKENEFGMAASSEDLESVINQLLTDSDLYNKLQDNINQLNNRFIWEAEEPKLIALYKNA